MSLNGNRPLSIDFKLDSPRISSWRLEDAAFRQRRASFDLRDALQHSYSRTSTGQWNKTNLREESG